MFFLEEWILDTLAAHALGASHGSCWMKSKAQGKPTCLRHKGLKSIVKLFVQLFRWCVDKPQSAKGYWRREWESSMEWLLAKHCRCTVTMHRLGPRLCHVCVTTMWAHLPAIFRCVSLLVTESVTPWATLLSRWSRSRWCLWNSTPWFKFLARIQLPESC